MHIFAILTNVLKEFDLKIEDMLIFVIINHCCVCFFFLWFFPEVNVQTMTEYYEAFSLGFLVIMSGFLYAELCYFSVQISSYGYCFLC